MASMHDRGVTHSTTSSVTEAAGQVKEKVQDFASGAAHRLGEAWDATRSGAENVSEDVASFVRRYPFAVAAAAFGIGFMFVRSEDTRIMLGAFFTARWE